MTNENAIEKPNMRIINALRALPKIKFSDGINDRNQYYITLSLNNLIPNIVGDPYFLKFDHIIKDEITVGYHFQYISNNPHTSFDVILNHGPFFFIRVDTDSDIKYCIYRLKGKNKDMEPIRFNIFSAVEFEKDIYEVLDEIDSI